MVRPSWGLLLSVAVTFLLMVSSVMANTTTNLDAQWTPSPTVATTSTALQAERHIPSPFFLQQRDKFFKGQPVPEINWMSPDIYNFTWGLAGVDNVENLKFSQGLWISGGCLLVVVLLYRTFVANEHYHRLIAAISSDRAAHFFAQPAKGFRLFIEKRLITAPLWKHRHNDAIKGPMNLHFGTLPARIHAILLFGYILSNVLYCTLWIPWDGRAGPDGKLQEPTKASLVAEFRGRTGVMAVVNMIPLFICIVRNNYVGDLVGVGFNTWNLYHRWIGRMVFLESHAHMIAWMVNKNNQSSWDEMNKTIAESGFLISGVVAIVALWAIIITAVAPFRHVFYQVFLGMHQISVIVFLIGVWVHCHIDQLPHKTYVNIVICIWAFDRGHRIWTICYKNFSFGDRNIRNMQCSIGKVKALQNGEHAVHLTVTIKNGWNFKPGTHAYIYVPRLSWTQSHPFSIAWSNPTPSNISFPLHLLASSTSTIGDKTLTNEPITNTVPVSFPLPSDPLHRPTKSTDLHFLISRKEGFTNRLFEAAQRAAFDTDRDLEKKAAPPKEFYVLVEGPYSNEAYTFDSFSTILFVAGGTGITHPLAHIRRLLAMSARGLTPTKRIKLVWVVRDVRCFTWIADWVEELWMLDAERGMLEIEVYVTRPAKDGMVDEDEMGRVKFRKGRPRAEVLVGSVVVPSRRGDGVVGAVAVNVCGPGALADGLRAACRDRMGVQRIEFSEESFTWS